MANVSKEMVDAVRMGRWEEWQQMAKDTPRGQHILSVELLRTSQRETAIVLTLIQNGRLVQVELRGDAKGHNPKPVISQRYAPQDCEQVESGAPLPLAAMPQIEALVSMGGPDGGDGGGIANSVAIGEPPPKEPPEPGAVALGSSLLQDTFDLGEHAVGSSSTT